MLRFAEKKGHLACIALRKDAPSSLRYGDGMILAEANGAIVHGRLGIAVIREAGSLRCQQSYALPAGEP